MAILFLLPRISRSCRHRRHAQSCDEMAVRETSRRYGPEQGYEWLRHAIAKTISAAALRTSPMTSLRSATAPQCAHTATSLIILGKQKKIAISDPVYPV